MLFTSAKGKAWSEAAQRLGITAHDIGDSEWATTHGVDETGAVLVRPDGYIGWRSSTITADPAAALSQAMASIFGRATANGDVTRSSIPARR